MRPLDDICRNVFCFPSFKMSFYDTFIVRICFYLCNKFDEKLNVRLYSGVFFTKNLFLIDYIKFWKLFYFFNDLTFKHLR